MKRILNDIFAGKGQGSPRKSFLWNMIASAVNAAEAVVVLMAATRFADMEEAGVLTISFTVANLMMCIGKYGVRNYQVTDLEEKKDIRSYFRVRLLTLLAMGIFTCLFLFYSFLFSHYSPRKAAIVMLTTAIYGIEAFEDVFLSEFQRGGRLDIGAKMFSFRWAVTLAVWCIGIVLFRSVLIPTAIAFLADLLLVMLLTLCVSRDLFREGASGLKDKGKQKEERRTILLQCLPLCAVSVLMIYLPNAAKYSIDMHLTDEIQACYGFIAMPVFVIDVVSFIIFQPMLKSMTEKWLERKWGKFTADLCKLCLAIAAFSGVCLAAGFFAGIPVLSWLYAVDLSLYKREFMILIMGGAAQAYIGLFIAILVIFRKQGMMIIPFCAVGIMTYFILNIVVQRQGILGASVVNASALGLLAVVLFAEIIITMLLERNKR